jgi:hypothetical protein
VVRSINGIATFTPSRTASRFNGWRTPSAWFSLAASLLVATFAPTRNLGLALIVLVGAVAFSCVLTPRSAPLRLYIVALLLAFMIFPLLAGERLGAVGPVVSLLAVWILAWSFGTSVASCLPSRIPQGEKVRRQWSILPFVTFGAVGLAVQGLELLRGVNLYSLQVTGQVDVGPDALLRAAVPASLAVAFWLVRLMAGSPGWQRFTAAAVAAQAIMLLFSGFRGFAAIYLLTVWLTGSAYGKQPLTVVTTGGRTRRAVSLVVSVVLLLALIQLAALRRADIAAGHGLSVAGTRTFSVDDPFAFADRFNYARYVEAAIDRASDPIASDLSSPATQILAFVPRVFWADKPIIYYGREVAYYYFDVPREYHSAETITFLGDLYVMGGPFSIVVVGASAGILFTRLVLRKRSVATGVSILSTYIAMTVFVSFEQPVILNLADAARAALVLAVLGAAARLGASTRARLLLRGRSYWRRGGALDGV